MTDPGKDRLRKLASAATGKQVDKDSLSRQIIDRLVRLPVYRAAEVVIWYVDVRDEVRTRQALPAALASEKTIVVPYCVGDELALFKLESMDELAPGRFGIPEPLSRLREEPAKQVAPEASDVILVPGVAFDARGGRLGHGKGFYDRLLAKSPATSCKIGIAFDCQVIESIPTEPHDVAMDFVVTPSRCIDVVQSSSARGR